MASRSRGRLATLTLVAVGMLALLAPSALAAPPLTTPDGLWTWTWPAPFGYPANAIAASAPGTLFVATSCSDALVTRNGGASWSWSPTNVSTGIYGGLSCISFASPSEGWATGDGVLLHTADGGLTWQMQMALPGLSFVELSFSDVSSGWAVASDRSQERTRVFTTTDGGQAWSEVGVPGHSPFTTLVTQGPGQALLVERGAYLWRTSDYGAHWSTPALLKSGYLHAATFVSPEHGWAIISGSLEETSDGGLSWRAPKGHSHNVGFFGAITSVGSEIWAVGASGSLHSPDAGKTWQKLPSVDRDPNVVTDISFANRLDGWVATSDAQYLHTTDGGKSWHRLTTAPTSGVSKLVALSDGTVWGAAGYVIKSSDGGKHWKRVTARRTLSSVAAIDAKRAWAVGPKGLIIHTADGGRHWSVQRSSTGVDLFDITFVDAKHGWVGALKGNILRTVDGGRHWTKNHTPVGGAIFELAFADAKHGIALAAPYRPYVLITANGGHSWSKMRFSPLNYEATAVSVSDATHAIILAGGPRSWITSDGGQSWQQGIDLPSFGLVTDIARLGSQLCAIDELGNVDVSRDDGASWSPAGSAPTVSAWSAACAQFVGSDTLLIGGSLGMVTRDLITAPVP